MADLLEAGNEEEARSEIDRALLLDPNNKLCLLYTSDAADERSSVDLGGRRIIKKKKQKEQKNKTHYNTTTERRNA